jgi:hypothetical protein
MWTYWKRIAIGAGLGLAVGVAPMLAGSPARPEAEAPMPAEAAAQPEDSCSWHRAWLAAEETTPGILQTLARDAVAECELHAATTRAVAALLAAEH